MRVDQVGRISGTINEDHTHIVKEVFGSEIADKMENARDGITFLEILFEMEKKSCESK